MELARLSAQPWVGNVRELRNAVERAALKLGGPNAPSSPIRGGPSRSSRRAIASSASSSAATSPTSSSAATSTCREAARQAGVDRRNFQRLLRRHQINPREIKRK